MALIRRLVLATLLSAGFAAAQSSTTVLLNGKILTVDPKFSIAEALAVRDGRIAAAGTSADLRKMAGRQARIIDLGGRTVIPGLIDSHMHAIRAALSFSTEVNWIGARSLSRSAGSNSPGLAHDATGRMVDRGRRAGTSSNSRRIGGPRRRSLPPPRRTIQCTFSWATAGRS